MNQYYAILDLTEGATIAEIKKAYRRKAKEYHPDVSSLPNAKELFIKATEAYEYLVRLKLLEENKEKTPSGKNETWIYSSAAETINRAQHFAQMSYRDFSKTSYYKATRVANIAYFYLSLGTGVVILFSVFMGLMHQLADPQTPFVTYFIDFMTFIIALVFIIFSMLHLIDLRA